MPILQNHKLEDLTDRQLHSIVSLRNDVWPQPEKSLDQLVEEFPKRRGEGVQRAFIIVWEGDKAIAHAEIFPREIRTAEGSLEILALAGVCVSRKHRDEGLGKMIVERAFAEVDNKPYAVCLFQTDIPSFYKRLGAKRVTNQFFNRLNQENPEANPWGDHYVMAYPETFAWPEGRIDLNGFGF